MTRVARFEIHYTQFLDHHANVVQELPASFRGPAALIPLYRAMVLTRTFDKKAIALQRTGQLGTFASCLGQEAIGVAIGSAMRAEDVLLPFYRDYAAQFLRGVRMTDIFLYWAVTSAAWITRSHAGISPSACRSPATPATQRGWLPRSSIAMKPVSPSVSWAMGLRPKGISMNPSISPGSGNCQRYS